MNSMYSFFSVIVIIVILIFLFMWLWAFQKSRAYSNGENCIIACEKIKNIYGLRCYSAICQN